MMGRVAQSSLNTALMVKVNGRGRCFLSMAQRKGSGEENDMGELGSKRSMTIRGGDSRFGSRRV